MDVFDFCEVLMKVCIDVLYVYFWDFIVINVFDKVVLKYCCEGVLVEVVGFNEVSKMIVDCLVIYDKFGVMD